MMTKKHFIEVLKTIKEYCKITSCHSCPLQKSWDCCKLQEITKRLTDKPRKWSIKKIEKLINE